MAITRDTFTDVDLTALTAHTGEEGATWATYAGSQVHEIFSNRCRQSGTSGSVISYASGVPPSAEYKVSGSFYINFAGDSFGGDGDSQLLARQPPDVNSRYQWGYVTTYQGTILRRWELVKVAAGAATILGTWSETLVAGDVREATLEAKDATKKGFVAGIERVSSTDNVVTAAGRAGVRTYRQNVHIDSIVAEVFDSTAPTPNITSQTRTRISRQVDHDAVDITFTADEAFVEYQIRIVPSSTADRTQGQLVEQAAVASTTSHTVTITDDEIVTAEGGTLDGNKILKVFVKDAAGNWS